MNTTLTEREYAIFLHLIDHAVTLATDEHPGTFTADELLSLKKQVATRTEQVKVRTGTTAILRAVSKL